MGRLAIRRSPTSGARADRGRPQDRRCGRGSGYQRPDDLLVAPPRPYRPRTRRRLSSAENVEFAADRRRIRELEAELAVHRRATELLKGDGPKSRFAAIDVMVAEGLPAQLACRVLDVSESGSTPAGPGRHRRAIRHA
jgi:hypothetical protein